ncbi:hypothetical protein DI53_3203 [Sphingobacterium deserti]|uniref:Uncharacterized protein n=1 Tax=Sphingobacterium deserti TaxID=1229276 RepID=A0A0B8SZJ7_9SPHI|nr:hypothetical protein DI53_3203 [Sphingobacterium deserti]
MQLRFLCENLLPMDNLKGYPSVSGIYYNLEMYSSNASKSS